jgi:sugar phosphate isomerase/epimerase
MKKSVERRGFLKAAGFAAAGLAWGTTRLVEAAELGKGAPHAEKLGWRLGCQAYSFNRYSFAQALEKTASVGLKFIEAYPGQKLTQDKPDLVINESLSPEGRQEVRRLLAAAGIKLVNYGVCGLSKNEAESRKTFDFAKDMGIETIVSEPAEDAFDTLQKLCEEYQINVAVHNHPKPSKYWNPDKVLEVCEGRSRRIGSCADTGHWMRSGLNPLEQLRKLRGRIVSFHFKDLNKYGEGAHDVPWGTGQADVKALLTEIKAQGIQAVFSIEYEHNWESSVPEIAQCVAYFDKIAAELS